MRRKKITRAIPFLAGLVLVALALAGSLSEPARAAPGGMPASAPDARAKNSECLACHSKPDFSLPMSNGEALSLTIDEGRFGQSVHGENEIACTDCHTDFSGFPHPALKADSPRELATTYYKVLDSVHQRALAGGNLNAAVCTDCHNPHKQTRITDKATGAILPNARLTIPQTCAKCHSGIYDTYKYSVHGAALTEEGNQDVPTCIDCHDVHNIQDPTTAQFRNDTPLLCAKCHTNPDLMGPYGLPTNVLNTYVSDFHGTTVTLFEKGSPSLPTNKPVCTDCHGVHDIRSSKDPQSHIFPANLATTCGKCHPGAGDSFQLGSVHGTPGSTNTMAVAWVRFAYLWLIALTVGFMATHNVLDLVNKALRPEHPHLSSMEVESVPPRMSRPLRWEHGLVMLSFPVLVYTGFALKYPEAWWAAPLLRWETIFGLRGFIHRVAGVVLLLASLWHVVHVVVSRRQRACMAGILPRPRDGLVLFGTLAYYVGLRETRPLSGAFSYIEKAEYWAFLWGTVVMVVTGFVLWFENMTLHYLPSWVPDTATAIYFYEAILATLSILVWHFYWVIFDPDVYPMDWTWWHGQAPPSRIAERAEEESDADGEDWESIQKKLIR